MDLARDCAKKRYVGGVPCERTYWALFVVWHSRGSQQKQLTACTAMSEDAGLHRA